MAEQLQVTLKACDQVARWRTSTTSEVMTQTVLTIPPPPIPANSPLIQNQKCEEKEALTEGTGYNEPSDRLGELLKNSHRKEGSRQT
jgi:hypothetical protein